MINDDCKHIAVIGCGIVGLTLAYEALRMYPLAHVTLIDQSEPLQGISGKAGAGDLPLYWSDRHRQLIEAANIWHTRQMPDTEYRTKYPVAWFGLEESHRSQIYGDTVAIAAMSGQDRVELDKAIPLALLTDVDCSIGHRISPYLLGRYLISQLNKTGRCRFIQGKAVDCPPSPNDVEIYFDDRPVIRADFAFVAAGPWSIEGNSSWAEHMKSLGVRTKRVFGMRARVQPGFRKNVIFAHASKAIFVMPTTHRDEIAISIKHDVWDVAPGVGELPQHLADTCLDFLACFTTLGRVEKYFPRVHVDTYTPDFQPVVAHVHSKLVALSATHGSGIRLASGLAQEALELAKIGL